MKALEIAKKRIYIVGAVGVIAGTLGAYIQAGVILKESGGLGLALLGVGFSLLIAALNQAFTWERQKLQNEYDEEIKTLLTEIRDRDCCSRK